MISTLVGIPGYVISEELYHHSRTIVYQAIREADSLPVVIKLLKNPYPSFSDLVQFRNQYTIAKNLNSPLIIQIYSLEPYQNSYALVMEDFGGISLKDYFASPEMQDVVSIQDFLQIAIALCNTLDVLYRDHIIHKDIKPSNILINPNTKQVKLIDFSIASLLPRETQTLISPNILEGTLAYISPEQTGRMNRGVDYRTDFYSLGVTFYELLTGELPFDSNDPMELVHCHIAKAAPSLRKVKNEEIPPVISAIVMKLMAKNAEDRYQSALGLKFDLEKCLHQLQQTGKIEHFEIAQQDVCDRFIIPDQLYGREAEIEILLQAFDRVSQGVTEMILVAGFSGIGKTAVINEVHKPIVKQRGYFIKGKFDQFNRNIPFSAFLQAFQNLMWQLLTESDTQIQQWKNKILDAVGENGQVIIEVIPELQKIIGQQPPAIELSGTAAQNRFNLLFQNFVQIFTTKEHPLVIFLDDLQWADSASLKLIQLLMNESSRKYLLLIGAYRDNEVSTAHPLILSLEDIKKSHAIINTIALPPLSHPSLNQLVADTLSCCEEIAQPLTELVYQNTKGNPFFTTQFLKALYEDGWMTFDWERGNWQCNITEIKALVLTDNVVEFMALQLQKLPQETQSLLKLAACIGNQFDLATLAIVCQQSEIETATCLWKALQEGLILPTSEIYKFYIGKENHDVKQDSQIVNYKFLHDRVQQAAYSLIPDEQKQQTHLHIGQLLLKNAEATPVGRREAGEQANIFEIVNHLNLGIDLITQPLEKIELANLNLMAGQKAKAAIAYESAFSYFKTGLDLLTLESWQDQYNLTLALHELAGEAACLLGDFESMQQFIQAVFSKAHHSFDQVKSYQVQLQGYAAQGRNEEEIQTALNVLQTLGIELPSQPTPQDIQHKLQQVTTSLSEKPIENLVNLDKMTDPKGLASMQILSAIIPVCYSFPQLLPLIILTKVDLSIRLGNADVSPFAYALYGAILCGVIGDIDTGYQFGQLAMSLLERWHVRVAKSSTLFIVNFVIKHWKQPFKETFSFLQEAYFAGLECGDLEHAAWSIAQLSFNTYLAGIPLEDLEKEMALRHQLVHQTHREASAYSHAICYQVVLNLVGTATTPYRLIGQQYDETIMLSIHVKNHDLYALCHLYTNKLMLSVLFEDYRGATEYAQKAAENLNSAVGMPHVPLVNFYSSLALLANYADTSQVEQAAILEKVAVNQDRMAWWASHAPVNYLHKFHLVEAQRQQILGSQAEAMELYDRAIAGAKANEYIHEEALANELAAKFYLDWGKEKVAAGYMQEAYYCYAYWGAKAKIIDLEKRYSQLLAPILQSATQPSRKESLTAIQDTVSHSSSSISGLLDLDTILKISQSFTSEIRMERLVEQVMQALVSTAGADKGALILNHEGGLKVVSQYLNSQVHPFEIQPLDHCFELPVSIVHYVERTLESTIASAEIPHIFAPDPYFSHHSPQSLLCTPILKQGQLIGLLYLENSLTILAFTSDRLEILNLLCTQAAISLENATLYKTLEHKVIERTHELSQALNDLKSAQKKLVESEKMAALGGLVAGVAHEINTPVGVGITLASTLAEETKIFKAAITEGQLKKSVLNSYLNTAEDCSNLMLTNLQRAGDLIQSFKQVAVDQSNLEQRQIFLRSYVEDILTSLSPKLRQAGHRLTVTGDETIEILTYPGAIAQLLLNLLNNSLIHAYPTVESGQLAIHISQTHETVTLVYSDDGCGIPPEALGKIFEPFFTTARDRGGSGLGLHIVYNLVTQKLGGAIDVESHVGQGTLFTIKLPWSL